MIGVKRFGELHKGVAILLLPVSPFTCPLLITAGEANPTSVDAPSPGEVEADEPAQDRASREVVQAGHRHGTRGVIVQSPEAAHAPASVVAAMVTLLRGVLAVGGATAAVLLNAHHRAASAADGRRTVSVQGTTTESAI